MGVANLSHHQRAAATSVASAGCVMGSGARIPGAAMEILLLLNRKWEPSESG